MEEKKKEPELEGGSKEENKEEFTMPSSFEQPEVLKEDQVKQEVKPIESTEHKREVPEIYRPSSDDEMFDLRKEKLGKVFSGNTRGWVVGFILAIITFLSFRIRVSNINGLKDVTTGDWTLGPDLDPFLFLRWAKEIVANGSLSAIDMMRNVPLGYNTAGEAQLLSYLIVWFYKFLSFLPSGIVSMLPGNPSEITVTYAAILFPAFMFVLTIIAFFVLTKEIFKDMFDKDIYSDSVALIASAFLAFLPIILPRTIAGIPEKESAGFFFIFLSFYFIIKAFKSKNFKRIIVYGILAGISTASLGLIWGGVTFVFMIVGVSSFVLFMLGNYDRHKLLANVVWVVTFVPISMFFSTRYSILSYLTSTSTAPIFLTLVLSSISIFVYPKIKNKKFISYFKEKWNLSDELIILIYIAIGVLILIILFLGVDFITSQIEEMYGQLVNPLSTTRFIRTVAENSQPYFVGNWKGSFGPQIANIPIYFWMFMIGSVTLFYNMASKIRKKQRILLTATYFIFIIGLIFSRHSPSSTFNGVSTESLFLYFGSALLFAVSFLYVYYKYNKIGDGNKLKMDFPLILVFMMFFVSILAARGGVRFVMVLVPPTSIMVAYFIISSVRNYFEKEKDSSKVFFAMIAIVLLLLSLFSLVSFYNSSKSQASQFIPSSYNQQWQKSMEWVRANTSENAVFAHWWDYGYWVQSIGERATILDGGNAIVYWNHLLGRHVLTAPSDEIGLEFLYTHDATHLLIDSTEFGKYSAFSSIGADENYDRFSFVPTYVMDGSATQETSGGNLYLYRGGANLDDDIIIDVNGTEQRIIKENSGVGGIAVFESSEGIFSQPELIVVSGGNQVNVPLRWLYFNGELHDFGSGYDGTIYLMEKLDQVGNGLSSNDKGAAFYLSERTSQSLLARKYLYGEEGNYKLVHSQSHPIIEDLRSQGFPVSDFILLQGSFIGPIMIWEIEYPSGITKNEEFLIKDYLNPALEQV